MATRRSFNSGSITVASSLTTLLEMDFDPAVGSVLSFDVENTGATALNAFAIEAKNHPDSTEWQTYLSGTDFDSTTNANMLKASDTGPHELGGDAEAFAHVRLHGVSAIRIRASVASGSTTAAVKGSVISDA